MWDNYPGYIIDDRIFLKNDIVEFNGERRGVKRQKSGTTIGTKYASFYADNFMDEVETEL